MKGDIELDKLVEQMADFFSYNLTNKDYPKEINVTLETIFDKAAAKEAISNYVTARLNEMERK